MDQMPTKVSEHTVIIMETVVCHDISYVLEWTIHSLYVIDADNTNSYRKAKQAI